MEAKEFIQLIEQGRRDKISPNALDLIAKRFREQDQEIESLKKEVKEFAEWCSSNLWFKLRDDVWQSSFTPRAHKTTSELFEMFKEETKKE